MGHILPNKQMPLQPCLQANVMKASSLRFPVPDDSSSPLNSQVLTSRAHLPPRLVFSLTVTEILLLAHVSCDIYSSFLSAEVSLPLWAFRITG